MVIRRCGRACAGPVADGVCQRVFLNGDSGRYELSLRPSVLAAAAAAPASGKKKKQQQLPPFEERLAALAVPAPAAGARPVRKFADVAPGMTVAGFVSNPTDKGVFVTLARGVTGRVKVRISAEGGIRAGGGVGAIRASGGVGGCNERC